LLALTVALLAAVKVADAGVLRFRDSPLLVRLTVSVRTEFPINVRLHVNSYAALNVANIKVSSYANKFYPVFLIKKHNVTDAHSNYFN